MSLWEYANPRRFMDTTDRIVRPLAVLAGAGLFFLDVLNRRVGMALPPWRTMLAGIGGSKTVTASEADDHRLARLRSTKSSVREAASNRYTAELATSDPDPVLMDREGRTGAAPPPSEQSPAPETRSADPATSYSERLLEVKRKLRERRD